MAISPQGYSYEIGPKSTHPFYGDGSTPGETTEYIKDISFHQDGETVTVTITPGDGDTTTQSFTTGSADAITGITLTNENGIYTITATRAGGESTEIGTIEIPAQERGIVEVKDSVVSNDTTGYDFHTITETEDGGTENEVGKFYLAQKQITGITKNDNELEIATVNQSGETATEQIELPSGSSGVYLTSPYSTYFSRLSSVNNTYLQLYNTYSDGSQDNPLNFYSFDSSSNTFEFDGPTATAGSGVVSASISFSWWDPDTVVDFEGTAFFTLATNQDGIRIAMTPTGMGGVFSSVIISPHCYVLLYKDSTSEQWYYTVYATFFCPPPSYGSPRLQLSSHSFNFHILADGATTE